MGWSIRGEIFYGISWPTDEYGESQYPLHWDEDEGFIEGGYDFDSQMEKAIDHLNLNHHLEAQAHGYEFAGNSVVVSGTLTTVKLGDVFELEAQVPPQITDNQQAALDKLVEHLGEDENRKQGWLLTIYYG